MKNREITNPGFIKEFLRRHEVMTDRPFCWVLGSGASVQSGIPSGGKLAYQWLAEMYELEYDGKLPIEQWATAETLGIADFDYARAANSYPWIYQRRFRDYKEQGYAFLETIMDRAEPSFGYSVLAQIMATKLHNVAVTTNFDNLIADALSIYARTFPLVCGHESLTGYIRPNLRRPLIAKIHRDLLLAPLNNPDEISRLPGEWTTALTKIFSRFTPIVIGYGGNDGSLMSFLKTLEPIEGGIFWCYRQEVEATVNEVVERHKGKLVPIAGFDEVMLQLWEALKLTSPLPQLQSVHDKRRADYQRQFEELTDALQKRGDNPAAEEARKPVRLAAEAAVERLTKEKDWWGWQLKANAEADPVKREAIFREGLAEFPQSAGLTGNFANYLATRAADGASNEGDEAESMYRLASELDPSNANNSSNFGRFLYVVRNNLDEAEKCFRHAVALAPTEPRYVARLATFLTEARRAFSEAESLLRSVLESDPTNPRILVPLAVCIDRSQTDPTLAEELYRRLIELEPENSAGRCNYAQFLAARGRDVAANEHAALGWELAEKNPSTALAEIALTRWLLDRANGRDSKALDRLKQLLGSGFIRGPWSFDALLAATLPRLPENERPLARKLADAILDKSKVAALDEEPLWRAVSAIPLDTPWPAET